MKLKDIDRDIIYFVIAALFITIVSFSLYKYGFPIYLVFLVIIPFVILFIKKLDIYFNLEKHKKDSFKVIRYPLILDNSVWLNSESEDNKKIFDMVKGLCKKYNTSFLLLRMQLDEIANIRHKAAKDEDSTTFKNATQALKLIEELQKTKIKDGADKKFLTIRGVSLKKIIEIEGVDDDAEYIQKVEIDNPLAQDAEITKDAYEGVYKSKLADGIKNILSSMDSKDLTTINLISNNEEIRIRARVYSDILDNKKIEVIDAKKALKSWEYVSKNTPKKFLADYYKKKGEKEKAKKKKKKALKDKIDFVIKP